MFEKIYVGSSSVKSDKIKLQDSLVDILCDLFMLPSVVSYSTFSDFYAFGQFQNLQ